MDKKTLQATSKEELARLLPERQMALHDLSFKAGTRQLTKVRQIRVLRREIAQILTSLGKQA